ncbi:hypothetical protein BWP33_03750 [Simonsiella muelleri ATCC 29453]|nr:hypothetical protein BWP33_03750 [Simonsiella muelleri ATCC 29453]
MRFQPANATASLFVLLQFRDFINPAPFITRFVQNRSNQRDITVFGAGFALFRLNSCHDDVACQFVQKNAPKLRQIPQTADVIINAFFLVLFLFQPFQGCFVPQFFRLNPQTALLPKLVF